MRNGHILYNFQRIDIPIYIDQLDVNYVRETVMTSKFVTEVMGSI